MIDDFDAIKMSTTLLNWIFFMVFLMFPIYKFQTVPHLQIVL